MQYYLSGRLSHSLLWGAGLVGVLGLLVVRVFVSFAWIIGVLAVLANPHVKRDLANYFRNKAAFWPAATVGLLLLTGVYTSYLAGWRHELLRSPLWLMVPLAFAVALPLATRQRVAVCAFFVLGTAGLGLATLAKYFLDPAGATAAIRIGRRRHRPALAAGRGAGRHAGSHAGAVQMAGFCLRPANRIDVHNQYVLALLGGGVVGLALLLGLLLWPLTQAHLCGNPFVCVFLVGQAGAMLADSVTALHIGRHLHIFRYSFLVVAAEAAHQQQKQRARNVPRAALPATEDSSEPAASQ